jgi:hypothetical protein
MISTLTTLLHLLVILCNAPVSYNILVIIATGASVLYHTNENNIIYYVIDHIIAVIWAVTDAYYSTYTILLNLLTAIMCYISGKQYHNYWHIFNAAKSICVVICLFG